MGILIFIVAFVSNKEYGSMIIFAEGSGVGPWRRGGGGVGVWGVCVVCVGGREALGQIPQMYYNNIHKNGSGIILDLLFYFGFKYVTILYLYYFYLR